MSVRLLVLTLIVAIGCGITKELDNKEEACTRLKIGYLGYEIIDTSQLNKSTAEKLVSMMPKGDESIVCYNDETLAVVSLGNDGSIKERTVIKKGEEKALWFEYRDSEVYYGYKNIQEVQNLSVGDLSQFEIKDGDKLYTDKWGYAVEEYELTKEGSPNRMTIRMTRDIPIDLIRDVENGVYGYPVGNSIEFMGIKLNFGIKEKSTTSLRDTLLSQEIANAKEIEELKQNEQAITNEIEDADNSINFSMGTYMYITEDTILILESDCEKIDNYELRVKEESLTIKYTYEGSKNREAESIKGVIEELIEIQSGLSQVKYRDEYGDRWILINHFVEGESYHIRMWKARRGNAYNYTINSSSCISSQAVKSLFKMIVIKVLKEVGEKEYVTCKKNELFENPIFRKLQSRAMKN